MSHEYVDLFDLMGIKPEEPKKEVSKKKTKSTKNNKEKIVNLPATVYTGYSEPIILSSNDFNGKSKIELSNAHEYLSTVYPDYPKGISILQKGKDDVLYLIHNDVYMVEKANMHFNKDTNVMLAGNIIDVSTVKTADECDVDCKELEQHFSTMFPEYGKVGFIHSAIDNVIVPCFNFPELTNDIDFPVRIGVFGRYDLIIQKEDYLDYINKKSSSADAMDAKKSEDNNSSNVITKAELKVIKEIVVKNYPDFAEGHLKLLWNEKDKMVIVKMVGNKIFTPATPKKEMYPTNANLSLLYITFNLSPDMFGGKDMVDAEELRKYIEKDRPEYSKERTNISYDKTHNLIIMVCNGSKKGIDIVTNDKEAYDLVDSKEYVLFDWYQNGHLYRVEQADAFCIIAPKPNPLVGSFKMRFPKVPKSFWLYAKMFFQTIYNNYKTEAAMQLFYDKENKKYFWNIPKQVATIDMCHITRDIALETKYSLVGEFHSHGGYKAYFSIQDDEDEKGYRIYGVFGAFNTDEVEFCMRAGTGGCFVALKIEDVFDDDCYLDPDVLKELYFQAKQNIKFVRPF